MGIHTNHAVQRIDKGCMCTYVCTCLYGKKNGAHIFRQYLHNGLKMECVYELYECLTNYLKC